MIGPLWAEIEEDFLCGESPLRTLEKRMKEIIVSETNESGSTCRVKDINTRDRPRVQLEYTPKGPNNPGMCSWVFAAEEVDIVPSSHWVDI